MTPRERILAALAAEDLATDELALAAHVHHVTAGEHIKALYEAGLVHIANWRRSPRGKAAAIYRLGSGTNAQRPKRRTPAQKCKTWREKNQGVIIAKRHAKKATSNPFAAFYLGL